MTRPTAAEVERISMDLLESGALTGNSDGTPDMYFVHPDDVPHLVATVLFLAGVSREELP